MYIRISSLSGATCNDRPHMENKLHCQMKLKGFPYRNLVILLSDFIRFPSDYYHFISIMMMMMFT
jgi:hypothetical protein